MKGLYIVTPNWDDTSKMLDITEKALKGGARLVQYRHKTASAEQRKEQAKALQVLCKRYGKPFIINDHVDLCLELGADGIHVGEEDNSVPSVRAAIGQNIILGASCYGDINLVRKAKQDGADYVAFGGFYPSIQKQYPVTTPVEIIARAKKELLDFPVCVIGGIDLTNVMPLIHQGTDMVSVISSVYLSDDPEKAARTFSQMFK